MTRQDVEFRTSDHVTLRGWLYTNDSVTGKAPCIVMCSGLAGIKEMRLDAFAEYFVAKLPVCCLLFDHRGWGDSDVLAGQPRNETIPMTQCSDITDAITFASTLEQVAADKIGLWGSSYSGGHVLYVGAVDKRVKLVLSQVPMVSGWNSSERTLPTDAGPIMSAAFANDRVARLQGKEPGYVPVADPDPSKQAMFSSPATCDFFAPWIDSGKWQNRITIKSIEHIHGYEPQQLIEKISPTPLLMTVGAQDTIAHADLALAAYARALEPKRLCLLRCGHFESYGGMYFEKAAAEQTEFIRVSLCDVRDNEQCTSSTAA